MVTQNLFYFPGRVVNSSVPGTLLSACNNSISIQKDVVIICQYSKILPMSHPWFPQFFVYHFLSNGLEVALLIWPKTSKAKDLKKEANQSATMKSHNVWSNSLESYLQKLTNYSLLKFVRFHQNQGLPHFLMWETEEKSWTNLLHSVVSSVSSNHMSGSPRES